jgi:hypothetical protein
VKQLAYGNRTSDFLHAFADDRSRKLLSGILAASGKQVKITSGIFIFREQ